MKNDFDTVETKKNDEAHNTRIVERRRQQKRQHTMLVVNWNWKSNKASLEHTSVACILCTNCIIRRNWNDFIKCRKMLPQKTKSLVSHSSYLSLSFFHNFPWFHITFLVFAILVLCSVIKIYHLSIWLCAHGTIWMDEHFLFHLEPFFVHWKVFVCRWHLMFWSTSKQTKNYRASMKQRHNWSKKATFLPSFTYSITQFFVQRLFSFFSRRLQFFFPRLTHNHYILATASETIPVEYIEVDVKMVVCFAFCRPLKTKEKKDYREKKPKANSDASTQYMHIKRRMKNEKPR